MFEISIEKLRGYGLNGFELFVICSKYDLSFWNIWNI